MRKLRVSLVLVMIFSFFATTSTVLAKEEKTAAADFSKKVKHPENQITAGEALNLKMTPGQKQKVSVELTNHSAKEITVEAKVAGTRTNSNGGLEYVPSTFPKDKTMKYDLVDLVKIPESVKVPGNGTADLVIDISMPEAAYDGIVTGGIQLMQKDHKVDTKDESGGMVINKFAFVFGVTLQMNDTKIAPDFAVRKVKAGLQNYRNAIIVDLANTQPMISKDLALNVEITEKGKKEVVYQKKKTDISIAPYTIMEYPVSMDGDRMKAGDYTANIVLKGYGKEWKWNENFKITDEEADKFNKEDPYLVQERGLNWKMVAMIVAGVVGLVILIVVILKLTKKDKKTKERKSASKNKKTKK